MIGIFDHLILLIDLLYSFARGLCITLFLPNKTSAKDLHIEV
ncbi:Uncharacterised protein [Vibrio cholerae]|nr:Uncharacterised protein [Vibrio cholerae]